MQSYQSSNTDTNTNNFSLLCRTKLKAHLNYSIGRTRNQPVYVTCITVFFLMGTRENEKKKISNTNVEEVMMRSLTEKLLQQKKQNNNNKKKKKNIINNMIRNKRLLITVNVVGSAGPLRFVVNEDDNVGGVIDRALKLYARESRLPVLASDINNFLLYPANAGLDALSSSESIGVGGGRNFVLCSKQKMTEGGSEMVANKGSSGWIAWLNKYFSFKIISSH